MIDFIKTFIVIFISFSSGAVIASAIFAFIAVIGIVPSIASKTKTSKYINLYEEMIIFGGIFGSLTSFVNFSFNFGDNILGIIFVILYSMCIGIFIGVLASSLAEILDVIPVFSKRANIKKDIALIMIIVALGKLVGSIIFFLKDNFQA